MLLSCKESGPKPSSQATHKYTEDVVFWVLRPVFWHFDFSVAIAGNKYEQGQSTCEVVFPCEWLLFWESDMRGGKLRVFLPTLSFILHYHFVLASSQRGCWGSVVCGPTTLPFWRGKRKTGLVPHSLCVLPLFGHLQLSTELPGQPLQLGLEWSRGVEYGDLKPFEKELNLPVTRYSNVTKWCWFLLFFFFLDWSAVLQEKMLCVYACGFLGTCQECCKVWDCGTERWMGWSLPLVRQRSGELFNKAPTPAPKLSNQEKNRRKSETGRIKPLCQGIKYPVVGYLCFFTPSADQIVNVSVKCMQTRLYKAMI